MYNLKKCSLLETVFANIYLLFTLNTILLLSINLQLVHSAKKERDSLVSSKIYELISKDFACFRRLNATHQVGCTSNFGGNVGVVHLVETSSDIEWIVNNGPHSPYVPLIYVQSFTNEILNKFQKAADRVYGVLVLQKNKTDIPKQFSPDSKCPNFGYGLYKNRTDFCPIWNEANTDLLHRDWTFPIFIVDKQEPLDSLVNCYKTFNKPNNGNPRDWPLCAAELESFMSAAIDTPTCIRRNNLNEVSISPSRVCDPLGDANVLTSLVSRTESNPYSEKSVIIIAARLDSASMFDRLSPGADTAATGITAILALVKLLEPLKQILLENTSKVSNIYFVLFNGEAFDYIGSSKVVYDMKNEAFPFRITENKTSSFPALIKMEDILYYIELNQLASEGGKYFIHRNWNASSSNGVSQLVDALTNKGTSLELVSVADNDLGVPPSSLHSFLEKDRDFPGIVITNHDRAYTNKFYNSIFDTQEAIKYNGKSSNIVSSLANIVKIVGNGVNELITSSTNPIIKSSPIQLIDDILQCYVKSPNCLLFQNVTSGELGETVYPLYVGVSGNINTITVLTHYVMAYYQGDKVNRTEDDCHREKDNSNMVFEYLWINGSCYETTAIKTSAYSPAFDDKNYDWNSRMYSTWTESVWVKLRVRIFLQPSLTDQVLTLVLGIVILLTSFGLFSWINLKTDLIFKSRTNTEGIC